MFDQIVLNASDCLSLRRRFAASRRGHCSSMAVKTTGSVWMYSCARLFWYSNLECTLMDWGIKLSANKLKKKKKKVILLFLQRLCARGGSCDFNNRCFVSLQHGSSPLLHILLLTCHIWAPCRCRPYVWWNGSVRANVAFVFYANVHAIFFSFTASLSE